MCTAIALLLLASPVAPSTPAPSPIAVTALVKDDAALAAWIASHSPDVRASDARVQQADADFYGARLLPNPSLDAELSDVNVTRSNPPGLGFDQTSIWSGGVTELVELGKRGPRAGAAKLRMNAARQDRRASLRDEIAQARGALARVIYLRARQQILDESLEAANHVLELEKTRLAHGDLSGNDYDRLVLDTLSLESDVSRSQAEYQGALAECASTLLAACDVSGATAADLDGAATLPGALADADAAISQRPEIASLELQQQAAARDASLAHRRVLPDLSARVGYTHDNLTISGDQQNTLGFSISFPLALFDHGQHDAAHALARKRELAAQELGQRAEANAEISSLLERRAFLSATVARLEKDAVDRSAGVLAATGKAFDAGQVSLTDLLLARRSHVQLLLNVLDLRFDYFSVRNDLRKALSLDLAAVDGS